MIKFKFFHNNPITPLEEIIETSNNFTPTQERIIVINQKRLSKIMASPQLNLTPLLTGFVAMIA
jgi:hypothetical protein